MTVLLFDIDGTLVRSGGSGKVAMELALQTAFGVREILDAVPYSGRTDRAIARDLLTVHGVPATLENQAILTDTYLGHLPEALTKGTGQVCPGIAEILQHLRDVPTTHLGLLTGNVRRGARTKLGHFGLWDFFPWGGGFGDDHYERNDVARSALHAAESYLKYPPNPNEVWVIGDTPLDVSCARHIGAKVIAVATGYHSMEELRACKPDAVFEDLQDWGAVLKLLD